MLSKPHKISGRLLYLILFVICLGVLAVSGWRNILGEAAILFDLDAEQSFPNWLSSILLFILTCLTGLIGWQQTHQQHPTAIYWRWLTIIFLGMSIEEVASARDRLITPQLDFLSEFSNLFYYSWVAVGLVLVLIFLLLYLRFMLGLPSRVRFFFIAGIALYVMGAVGFELISGVVRSAIGYTLVYKQVTTIEEALELVGILALLHASFTYLLQHTAIPQYLSYQPQDSNPRTPAIIRRDALISSAIVALALVGLIAVQQDGYTSLARIHARDGLPMDAPPNPEPIRFGDEVPFWGGRYQYVPEWDLIDVQLWWWANNAPDENYSIGVYMLDESGALVAQTDGAIQDVYSGTVELAQMQPNRIYLDQRNLILPDELPTGTYTLQLAVYQWWDDTRLTLPDGETLLTLGEVSIP